MQQKDPLTIEREDEQVDIGNNVYVRKSILDDIKADYRHQPGIFIRKLMEKSELFTLEEIGNCSLTGQKSNNGHARPALDKVKFSACKGNILCFIFYLNYLFNYSFEYHIKVFLYITNICTYMYYIYNL